MVNIYPKALSDYIKDNNYLPKVVKYKTDIRQYGKYFSLEEGNDGFKIEEVIDFDGQIYYQIRFLYNNRQAVVPYEENFHYYELLTDKSNIKELSKIINTGKAYYGSEIKYWFYTHNIDLESKKYKDFKTLISCDSIHSISDRKIYEIKADYIKGRDYYTNCRVNMITATT